MEQKTTKATDVFVGASMVSTAASFWDWWPGALLPFRICDLTNKQKPILSVKQVPVPLE